MKPTLSLLALAALLLSTTGCDTLANRRRFYAPKKGEGYWTRTLHDGTWKDRGVKPVDQNVKRPTRSNAAPAPAPAPEPAPAASTPAS